MRIDVLNTMVVFVLRYHYSVKNYWPKTVACQHTRRDEFLAFSAPPPNPAKYYPRGKKFAQTENSGGVTYPPTGVSRCPRSQSPRGSYRPAGRPWPAALWKKAWPGEG